ncbi:hypothetical protein EVA_03244 [gut metagenome]|uniref:Uncharacterized protein n=1 Tax=gut metagenome TaxID=749906 RepID=J9GMA9_9ZZZZ
MPRLHASDGRFRTKRRSPATLRETKKTADNESAVLA